MVGANRLRPCPCGQGPPRPCPDDRGPKTTGLILQSGGVEHHKAIHDRQPASCCQAATTRDDALDKIQPLRNEHTMSHHGPERVHEERQRLKTWMGTVRHDNAWKNWQIRSSNPHRQVRGETKKPGSPRAWRGRPKRTSPTWTCGPQQLSKLGSDGKVHVESMLEALAKLHVNLVVVIDRLGNCASISMRFFMRAS